jgi:hypothetical protein
VRPGRPPTICGSGRDGRSFSPCGSSPAATPWRRRCRPRPVRCWAMRGPTRSCPSTMPARRCSQSAFRSCPRWPTRRRGPGWSRSHWWRWRCGGRRPIDAAWPSGPACGSRASSRRRWSRRSWSARRRASMCRCSACCASSPIPRCGRRLAGRGPPACSALRSSWPWRRRPGCACRRFPAASVSGRAPPRARRTPRWRC